jgi:hypothetical protein
MDLKFVFASKKESKIHLFIAVSYSVRAASISLPQREGSTSYRHRILKEKSKEKKLRMEKRREKKKK